MNANLTTKPSGNGKVVAKSEKSLRIHLKRQIANKRTYRSIAMDYPSKITCGDIHRIVNSEEFPKLSAAKREALGLPCLVPVPVCPIHGVAHTTSCPAKRRKRKPPPAMTPEVEKHLQVDLCLGEWKIINGKMWIPLDGVIDILKKPGWNKKGYRLVHRNVEK